MRFGPLVFTPAVMAGCQFPVLPDVPSHHVTVSAHGLWTGADVAVRLTRDNAEPQQLAIDREGSSSFAVPLETGASFAVEVEHGDEYHTCVLANENGSIDGADHEVSLGCTATVPVRLEFSSPGLNVDLQRTRQTHLISFLQQDLSTSVDGPPGTLVRIDGMDIALASPSPPKPLTAGANELVVTIDVTALNLSRTYLISLDRGAAFAAEDSYIKAGNLQAEDWFGHAITATDEYVVVGAPQEDGSGSGVNPPFSEGVQNSGAAYVFRRVGQTLVPEAYLKLGGNTPDYRFASAVAASGGLLAVGAPQESFQGPSRGAAVLFRRTGGGNWAYETTLRASDATDGDKFGSSVAVHGDTVAVGAWLRDEGGTAGQGAVYVFRREGGGWSEVQRLVPPGIRPQSYLGYSIALTDEWLAASAECDSSAARGVLTTVPTDTDAPCSGAVYIYRRGVSGWEFDRFIKASNADANDRFGQSVALDGETLVVGAYTESGDGSDPMDNSLMNAGAVYVFEHGPSGWAEAKTLKAALPVERDLFGYSVSVLGDMIAVGCGGGLGSVELFRNEGGTWNHVDRRLGATFPDGNDQFGGAVALVRDGLVVGALMEDGTLDPMSNDARNSGAAYFFR